MPLIRITLAAGKSRDYCQAVGEGVHRALVSALQVPQDDRFQIVSELAGNALIYDPGYLGIRRDDDIVFIQVFLRRGRDVAMKQEFYRQVAANLTGDPGVAAGNIFITLHENGLEDWSFGDGEAQYVIHPPAAPKQPGVGKLGKSLAGFYGAAFLIIGLLVLLHSLAPGSFDAVSRHLIPLDDLAALASFTA